MSSINNYGELELPEESTKIEVVEDPVKVILSTYQMFHDICTRNLEARRYTSDDVMNYAESVFKGKEHLKLNEESVKEILKEINKFEKYYFYMAGEFLSAMHNTVDLEVLTINEKTNVFRIGDKLKQGKTLVLGPNFTARYIGSHSEGNVLNYANGGAFAAQSKYGIKIENKGLTLAGSNSNRFEKVIRIHNAFRKAENWSVEMKKVIFLPWEKGTFEIREYIKNGTYIKKYELHELIQPSHHQSHLIYPENLASFNSPVSQKLLNILAKFEKWRSENKPLEYLCTKTSFEQADEVVKIMKNYDMNGTVDVMNKFAEEILDNKIPNSII